jgi:hypothetical protein
MSPTEPNEYPPATAHDPIEEIFPDVFLVRGSYRLNALMSFGRNMVVLRHGGELTIVNSIRLIAAGEAQLDQLGTVRHVMRLGYFHGQDDRYYIDRYSAEFWGPLASRAVPGPAITQPLDENSELPVPGVRPFLFKQSRHPEMALLVEREGGILLTCDALQYYADRRFCSLFAKVFMPLKGFPLDMIIGPIWLKAMTPAGGSLRADFDRIRALSFKHFVAAHGSLLRDDAHAAVARAIDKAFAAGS